MASNTIKLRATEADGLVTVKALITHPMEMGNRKDAKTGELIPAHFIQDVTVTHAGNAVVSGTWSSGVSKDPYLSVRFAGKKGDDVTVAWKDNKGDSDTVTAKVG
jgi:sulfur-oxidizing protein SoxZ